MSISKNEVKAELEKLSPQPGDLILVKLSSVSGYNLPDNSDLDSWRDVISNLKIDAQFLIYVSDHNLIKMVKTHKDALDIVASDIKE